MCCIDRLKSQPKAVSPLIASIPEKLNRHSEHIAIWIAAAKVAACVVDVGCLANRFKIA